MTGSLEPSTSTRTNCSSVVCTSATPGTWRNVSASAFGARRMPANTSAKRPPA